MQSPREEHRVGVDYLQAVTELLQRVRAAHPTKGLYEAADFQWSWRTPLSTDNLGQLFWFDHLGRPAAAVIANAWGDEVVLDPVFMPDASPGWVAQVVERGLAHANDSGFGTVELMVTIDGDDHVTRDVLVSRGFVIKQDQSALVVHEAWLAADARPAISPLRTGYQLANRETTALMPHHMIQRSGPDVDERLRQTSLYRPDLDLLVLDGDDRVAAYALFWFDPATATGLVEPMRTEDDHQRKGLARHLLTTGVDLLARAGAERIKICFSPHNPPAKNLYLSVGFEPVKQTEVFSILSLRSATP
jgi:GNAT superfamily N-acetyltransferase